MPLFRRKPAPAPVAPPPVNTPDDPSVDWSDEKVIRGEWEKQLEGESGGRLGWSNGRRLFAEGPVPAQLVNVAEYMSRGLAYTYVGQPLFPDDQAAETVRQMLAALSSMPPTVPAFQWRFARRIARLALAVTRQKGWQPVPLGGDGQIGEQFLQASVVLDAITAPGVSRDDYLRHFFAA